MLKCSAHVDKLENKEYRIWPADALLNVYDDWIVSCIVRRRAVLRAAVGMGIPMSMDIDGYGDCDQFLWAYGNSMGIFEWMWDLVVLAI